jgi:hypothetical protein
MGQIGDKTMIGRKPVQNAVERAYSQTIWSRIALAMSAAREEVFVCSLIYKMMEVSLLMQTAVNNLGLDIKTGLNTRSNSAVPLSLLFSLLVLLVSLGRFYLLCYSLLLKLYLNKNFTVLPACLLAASSACENSINLLLKTVGIQAFAEHTIPPIGPEFFTEAVIHTE